MPTKGTLGNCRCKSIRRLPGDCTSLSLDASLRSRCVSSTSKLPGALRSQIDQTGFTNRSGRFWPVSHARSSTLALWLSQVTEWFSGEPLYTPRTWCSLCQSPLMTRLPQSPGSTLVLRLNQETVHQLHLAVLATMRPALDPAGQHVPWTKPTCLLHTRRPHRQRPVTLVLHLHPH
jgi:hypothetical protein